VGRWSSGTGCPGTGGSAWESNPAPLLSQGATDFEDREGHRAPFASEAAARCGRGDRLGLCAARGRSDGVMPAPAIARSRPSQTVVAGTASALDQANLARPGTLRGLLDDELHALAFAQ